jgi:hypothetical protein
MSPHFFDLPQRAPRIFWVTSLAVLRDLAADEEELELPGGPTLAFPVPTASMACHVGHHHGHHQGELLPQARSLMRAASDDGEDEPPPAPPSATRRRKTAERIAEIVEDLSRRNIEPLMTQGQAMAALNVTKKLFLGLIRDGELPVVTGLGKRRKFELSDIRALIDRRKLWPSAGSGIHPSSDRSARSGTRTSTSPRQTAEASDSDDAWVLATGKKRPTKRKPPNGRQSAKSN